MIRRKTWTGLAALLAVLVLWTAPILPASAQACAPNICCATNPTTGAPACGAAAGNPLNVMSGNKFQREEDMPALPGVLGLELVRYYNSEASLSDQRGSLGRGWRLSYDAELVVQPGGNSITVHQGDGTQSRYFKSLVQPEPGATLYNSNLPGGGSLRLKRAAPGSTQGSEYILSPAGQGSGNRQTFDAQGKLVQITAPTGEYVSMQRDVAGFLLRVTDPQGRFLALGYLPAREALAGDKFRGVQHIDSPVGRFGYAYGSPAPQGSTAEPRELLANLVKVSLPTHYDASTPANVAGGSADRGVSSSSVSRSYHYEDARRPTLLTGISVQGQGSDANIMSQRLVTWGYDAKGRANLSVKGSYDPAKAGPEQVTLEFNVKSSDGSGTTVLTNSLGQTTRYSYAQIKSRPQLLEVRGAGCATCGAVNVRYGYDDRGRQIQQMELEEKGLPVRGQTTEYDGVDRPIRISAFSFRNGKASEGRLLVRYQYGADPTNRQPVLIARPSVIAGKEHITRIEYNDKGQSTRVSEQGFSPVDESGALLAQGAPIGRTITYGYSAINGRSVLTSIDGPLPNGPKNSPEDSDVTRVEWDARGDHVLTVASPGEMRQQVHQRDVAGRPGEVSSSDGIRLVTAFAVYDTASRPTEKSYTATMLGGATGRQARLLRHAVRFQYDANGRLTKQLGSDGEMLQRQYDVADNITRLILRDGSQVAHAYDSDGRRTATALYGSDARGGLMWSYQYVGRELSVLLYSALPGASARAERAPSLERHQTLVDGGINWIGDSRAVETARRFSLTKQVEEVSVSGATRPDGTAVRRQQDDFGRTVMVTSPELGIQTAAYDATDQLALVIDRRGLTRYSRDLLGRPQRVESTAGLSGAPPERTQYSYRGAVLVAESHYVDQREDSRILWEADAWGRMTGKRLVILPEMTGGQEVMLATHRRLDEAGRAKALTLPSGARVDYERDRMGRLIGIRVDGRELVKRRSYAIGHQGTVATGQVYGNGLVRSVELDADGRVRAIKDGPQRKTFDRDETGRVTRAETAPQAVAEAAPEKTGAAVPDVVQSVAEYRYDPMGRLTSEAVDGKPLLSVQYDPSGDRRGTPALPLDAGRNVSQIGSRHLVYDARGQLSRIREQDGSVIAQYRYDADGIRIAKRTDKQAGYFLYEEGRLLAETQSDGQVAVEYVYADGIPVARLRRTPGGRQVEYLHTDHRGAVESVTDAQGQMIWGARQSAFGMTEVFVGAKADMPLRLLGQYEDGESGLHYNVHRYFDPTTGRYLQPDPRGVAPSVNLYAYADSDPLGKNDPLGLEPEPDDSVGLVNATLFGTMVHTRFAEQVRRLGLGWGADTSRDKTWTGMRPDAFSVNETNLDLEIKGRSFAGELWELKPIGWRWDSVKYETGLTQVKGYITGATRGCWVTGSSTRLSNELRAGTQLPFNGKMWDIRYIQDSTNDRSGLIFYARREMQQKLQPVPVPAPAPSLSQTDNEELEAQMRQIKQIGAQEGWSALQIIGMIVLIGLAIAVLLAAAVVVAQVLAAIIAGIATLLSVVAAGKVALMAGLAALFGFSTAAIAADAHKKGEEKQAGVLDKTINWFKSWF